MRRAFRWPMTVAWIAMGLLVTTGFYITERDDQKRCEAGNELRRESLPQAFEAYSVFLGRELGAPDERIDDATARFAKVMDELFPARDCSMW